MDVLADVLSTLELGSELYFRAVLAGPFSIGVPEDRSHIRFHVVADGTCWIGVDGGPTAMAGPGDLVLVPHGTAHVLADAPETNAVPLADVLETAASLGDGEIGWPADGAPGDTILVCGHFSHSGGCGSTHPLFASLPSLLHLRAGASRDYGWISALLRHLGEEVHSRRMGTREVVRRLSEVILIEALRAHFDDVASSGGGALPDSAVAALLDPQLRRVLEAIHERPADDWSLAALASLAGVSRTVLCDRFKAALWTSPMRYLAQWRLEKARHLLAQGDLNVGEVGTAVGYASEAAFSRAFKARHGEAPGSVRGRRRQAA